MSKFTKRHYVAIAKELELVRPTEKGVAAKKQWIQTVESLAFLFKSDNSSFKEATFLEACGGDFTDNDNAQAGVV